MNTTTTVCTAGEDFYKAPDRLNLFDRINLAQCAAKRARVYVIDSVRFQGEYVTAAAWGSKS
jgi:hypothetical protein